MKPVPYQDDQPLVDILTPETSVFTLFVPLTHIKADKLPLPKPFLTKLLSMAKQFHAKGVKLYLATDSNAITKLQFDNLKSFLKTINVQLFDISSLPDYLPYDKHLKSDAMATEMGVSYTSSASFWQRSIADGLKYVYKRNCQSTTAEYIDKCKIMLANLAGSGEFQHILVTDFDIEIKDSLFIRAGNQLAFTYSQRHEKPSTSFSTENSMIFVSGNRPNTRDGSDLIVETLKRINSTIDNPMYETRGLYGCYCFSTLCHDSIIGMHSVEERREIWLEAYKTFISSKAVTKAEEEGIEIEEIIQEAKEYFSSNPEEFKKLEHPSGIDDGSENSRELIVNYCTEAGDYLLHGDYYSPNSETWRHPRLLKFPTFEEAYQLISQPEQTDVSADNEAESTPLQRVSTL